MVLTVDCEGVAGLGVDPFASNVGASLEQEAIAELGRGCQYMPLCIRVVLSRLTSYGMGFSNAGAMVKRLY